MNTDVEPAASAPVPSASDVRDALGRILASAPFARSPLLQRFMTFLVEESLAGRGDRLKEYVVGLEVFSRSSTYDPRVDSIVRVEARRLRAALQRYYTTEGRGDSIIIDLQKGRYAPSFRVAPPPQGSTVPPDAPTPPSSRWATAVRVLAVVGVLAGVSFFLVRALRPGSALPLAESDAVVVLTFNNSTNEPIFDETLKQRLVTEIEQSPFLDVVSERRVAQALRLMGQPAVNRLDREGARDLCLRAGAKVVLAGSLSRLGGEYVIGLTATACGTGDDFVHIQETASRREAVLRSLSAAANAMRRRLGESLASIGQYRTPIEDATTGSLEALQAYSLGRKAAQEKGSPADIVFYERALELDAGFAAAHAALGVAYMNLGQASTARQCFERAYAVRDRVSERERYRISAYYHQAVTGNLEKAGEVYELWRRSYPREFAAHANLALVDLWLGNYERALQGMQEALRLEPANVLAYTNLAAIDIKLDRPSDAQAVLDQARSRGLTSTLLRLNESYLAFLRARAAGGGWPSTDAAEKPAEEAAVLSLASDTEAYRGRLDAARALSRRSVELARRAGGEAAAIWLLSAALREAEFGNATMARKNVREALSFASGRDVTVLAALASARAGDWAGAERLASSLEAEHPDNTVIGRYWLPTIRAAIEIDRHRAGGAKRLLESVSPYDLASPPPIGLATLYPAYLRGEACLLTGDGQGATREFRKLLDRPGLVLNFPLAALARLQTGRAHRLAGDREAAVSAYDDFLSLWDSADPGIPVLRQARSERARLR